jgi:hypothetical protein
MEIERGNKMFTDEKETLLQVLPNKCIKITIITKYLKDGYIIGQETWQQIIEPFQASIENAKTFLDDYYMNIIYHTSSFISPCFIQPAFLIPSDTPRLMSAGRIK